jgi:hypothetical protein
LKAAGLGIVVKAVVELVGGERVQMGLEVKFFVILFSESCT